MIWDEKMNQIKQTWNLTLAIALSLVMLNASCMRPTDKRPVKIKINTDDKTGEDLFRALKEIASKDVKSADKAIRTIDNLFWKSIYDLKDINQPPRPRFGQSELDKNELGWSGYEGVQRVVYWSRKDKKDTHEVIGLVYRKDKVEVFQAKMLAPN